MKDSMKLTGQVRIKLFDANGNLKDERYNPNVIVTVGKNYLATWLTAASQAGEFMSYVALGTGVTAASASDTALQTELTGGTNARVVGVLTSSGAIWTNTSTFVAGNGTGAVTEAGLFSALTSGTMFAHQVFSAINKGAGDTLEVTWQVTFS
jgi:hypothetical protein